MNEGLKFIEFLSKEKTIKNLITLHSSELHCDLFELEEKIKQIKNIEKYFISKRNGNEIIEIED